MSVNPTDRTVLKERSEVEDDLAKASFDLTEDLEMVLLIDEKAEQSSAYRTYQEDEQRLITHNYSG